MENDSEAIFLKIASQCLKEEYSCLPQNCQTHEVWDVLSKKLISTAIKYNYTADKFDELVRDSLDFLQYMQHILLLILLRAMTFRLENLTKNFFLNTRNHWSRKAGFGGTAM